MTVATATDQAGRLTIPVGTPYGRARALAVEPADAAERGLRRSLVQAPADPDTDAVRLWHMLRRHRVGAGTIDAVNRLLAVVPLLDRQVTVGNAFQACVLAREALLRQREPRRYFRYATIAHAAGMVAFWERYGRSLEVEHDGSRFVLRTGDRRVVYSVDGPQLDAHFDFFFLHEPGMWGWFADMTPGDVLLDVGANVGLYSVAAAALRGCRVVGLEPFPVNVAAAVANVAANGLDDLVRILPIAAAARSGHGRLSHDKVVPGVASQAFHLGDGAASDGKSEMPVEGMAIDDLVARGDIPFPTRIKIDVDGGEEAVVAGMQATLADPRLDSIRMEIRWWHPGNQAVVDTIRRHGFQPSVADDRKNLLFRRGRAGLSQTGAGSRA